MADIVVNGNTSGAVTLSAPAVAGTVTVTLPSTTGTMLTTASTTGISGSAISSGTVPEAYGGTGTSTGYYGFKNRIINGAMVIDQRNAGASLAVTASTVQYSVDRFLGISSNPQCTLQQVATSNADFPYALRVARTTGGVGTNIIQSGQIIETNNCQDLAGQTVAFSFYATAGANFSAASSQIVVNLTCGSGTNQGAAAAFITGTWTSQTTPLSTTQAITTTRTLYTYSVSIPAGTNEIGIRWYYTPVGTAGANDWFQITGVQLEKGSTATSFDYRPYGTELQLCQRYYESTAFPSTTFSQNTTTALPVFVSNLDRAPGTKFTCVKRAAPTVVIYSRNNTSGKVSFVTTGADNAGSATASAISETGYSITIIGTATTAGVGVEIGYTATAEL